MTIPLLLGILSSGHCLAMCGPLFSALLFTNNKNQFSFLNFTLYQFSRIIVYSLLGFIPIIMGLNYIPIHIQQIISIVCGILMLILIWANYSNTKINGSIRSLMKKINRKGMTVKNSSRYFILGAANGILPCGMVYIALTASIGNIQYLHPALFMLLFGLATVPVFLILYIIRSTSIGNSVFKSLFKIKPYVLSAIAVLLILRGLNLSIPFISPGINQENNIKSVSCCHDPNK